MNANRTFPHTAATPRTENQVDFLKDLITQIAKFDRERGVVLWEQLRDLDNAGQLTFAMASRKIDAIKAERGAFRAAQVATPRPPLPEVPDGRYAVDNKDGETAFYRVRVSDSGYVTVSVMASDEQHELPFVVARSVLQKIEADGVREAAIRYGKEIGVCGVCGRTLTDETSRAAGIGPICSQRV